jgi:hypothetical protein
MLRSSFYSPRFRPITASALFDRDAPENIPARKYSLKTRRRGIVSEEKSFMIV